jgi:predicted alternative tryptophan synthase beta-subunit
MPCALAKTPLLQTPLSANMRHALPISNERYIEIPDEVLQHYLQAGRPTPLIRAKNLEKALRASARIFFKYEGVLQTGSQKFNTAVAQAYYSMKEGVERLCTEAGADQWGKCTIPCGESFRDQGHGLHGKSKLSPKAASKNLNGNLWSRSLPEP